MPAAPSASVFINCPFDRQYQPLFDAVVFCVVACGFEPRCTLELTDAGEVRIENIYRLIGQCNHSIHDISRTEVDDQPYQLPRFNMPLELGIFLGAKRFGGRSPQKALFNHGTRLLVPSRRGNLISGGAICAGQRTQIRCQRSDHRCSFNQLITS